jgi:chromosome segregation ATPase
MNYSEFQGDLRWMRENLEQVAQGVQNKIVEKESLENEIFNLRLSMKKMQELHDAEACRISADLERRAEDVERYLERREADKGSVDGKIDALLTSQRGAETRLSALQEKASLLQLKLEELENTSMKKANEISIRESQIKELDKEILWRKALLADIESLEQKKEGMVAQIRAVILKEQELIDREAVIKFKESKLDGKEKMIAEAENAVNDITEKTMFLFEKSAQSIGLPIK